MLFFEAEDFKMGTLKVITLRTKLTQVQLSHAMKFLNFYFFCEQNSLFLMRAKITQDFRNSILKISS